MCFASSLSDKSTINYKLIRVSFVNVGMSFPIYAKMRITLPIEIAMS